jgi:hypothetical protein
MTLFSILKKEDVCNSDPCFQGTCGYASYADNNYICACDRGYTGTNCDQSKLYKLTLYF